MIDVSEILFQKAYNERVLFKNQLDLVNSLLAEKGSEFYVEPVNEEKYLREQIRLKTLVSQLLSPNVFRNIPYGFPQALKNIISKKIGNETEAEKLVNQIIENLKQKNVGSNKGEVKRTLDLLRSDFKEGNYIAIITSTPLEIEADTVSNAFSLRQLFVTDFLENLHSGKLFTKRYRLLFPVRSSCILFWKGLREILYRNLRQMRSNQNFIIQLKERVDPLSLFQSDLFDVTSDQYLHDLTIRLLTYLNKEGFLKVFLHETPIFNLPLIAITPAELKSARVYTILSSDKGSPDIHKYSLEEIILWRHFVWDRLKLRPFSGETVDFFDVKDDEID